MKEKIHCHIISGFLGAGKSHFIQQLLANKPADEKWAVLVNESGNTRYPNTENLANNVFVKEVYGGCLCCSAGMPFRVALNQLIKTVNPQRIFIEPAGAGHLANIEKLLQGEFYHSIIELQPTLCLLSEKQLSNKKYSQNASYLALIEQADRLAILQDSSGFFAKKMAKQYAKPLYILEANSDDLSLLNAT